MALNGLEGHKFSQAPQPMQRFSSTAGIMTVCPLCWYSTIWMAPVGQWRAQLPQLTPSVSTTQFCFTQTA